VLYLAAEWPTVDNGLLDPDGLFVIWKLRQGVKWHDGEDFNAEDVVFTYEWIADPENSATTLGIYATVESVEMVDEYTVQVNFTEPNPAWSDPFMGAQGCVLPQHVFADYMGAAGRDAPANLMPVGTGPFKVKEFKPGDVALYEIFMDYWDPGKPHLDEVEIKGGGDAVSAARAVLQSGEADWAWNLQIEPAILNQMAGGGQGELVLSPGNSAERIMVNFADPRTDVGGAFSEPSTQHPWFSDVRVRQAINLAIQRDVVTEQLYGPGNEPTAYILNVPERLKPEGLTWEYNLEAAQALLDEAGFEPGFNILYSTSVNSARQKTQEIVKEDLEKLGFVVELKSVDSAVYFASDAGNPDTYAHFYADLTMYTNGPSNPYPISWAERFRSDDIAEKANDWSGTNITRYNNPDFDALHDRARTAIDEQEQVEIWQQMMQIPYDDVVEIPIVWRGAVAAKSNRVVIDPVNMTNWGDSNPTQDLKNWTFSG
jgi:peptide/nickel transport system substrate-binding protein